jgi:WD40 repeat protein
MIPEHRLARLLDEIKDDWIANCSYHNTTASPSLYLDHNCDRDDFPTKAVLELKLHKDEVWFVQYSHDGSKLASASKDTTIFIYETQSYNPVHCLDDHQGSGVTHLAWSPDDTKIITCCSQPENAARIWDVKVYSDPTCEQQALTSTDWCLYPTHQRLHISMYNSGLGAVRQASRHWLAR